MTPRTSTNLRRLTLAALLAAAVVLGSSANASSAPNFDVGYYNACMNAAENRHVVIEVTTSEQFTDEMFDCCADAGGEADAVTGWCDEVQLEAEPESGPPPPGSLDSVATMFMPPPVGPVGPPPSEATQAP